LNYKVDQEKAAQKIANIQDTNIFIDRERFSPQGQGAKYFGCHEFYILRKHSAIGYTSPEHYEEPYLAANA